MTRSRRKIPIVKGPKVKRNWYNRRVKRHQRQQTRDILTLKDILDYEISSSREIVNDYDVCDYKFDYRFLTPFMKSSVKYDGFKVCVGNSSCNVLRKCSSRNDMECQ